MLDKRGESPFPPLRGSPELLSVGSFGSLLVSPGSPMCRFGRFSLPVAGLAGPWGFLFTQLSLAVALLVLSVHVTIISKASIDIATWLGRNKSTSVFR